MAVALTRAREKASMTRKDFLSAVNAVFQTDLTKSWLDGFLRRHEDFLKVCKARVVTKTRCSANIEPEVVEFCGTFEWLVDEHCIKPHQLINIDECRLAMRRDGQTDAMTLCGVDIED